MQAMYTKEQVDEVAEKFCHLNNKQTRKRFIKTVYMLHRNDLVCSLFFVVVVVFVESQIYFYFSGLDSLLLSFNRSDFHHLPRSCRRVVPIISLGILSIDETRCQPHRCSVDRHGSGMFILPYDIYSSQHSCFVYIGRFRGFKLSASDAGIAYSQC
jgi:hypothetical protein